MKCINKIVLCCVLSLAYCFSVVDATPTVSQKVSVRDRINAINEADKLHQQERIKAKVEDNTRKKARDNYKFKVNENEKRDFIYSHHKTTDEELDELRKEGIRNPHYSRRFCSFEPERISVRTAAEKYDSNVKREKEKIMKEKYGRRESWIT